MAFFFGVLGYLLGSIPFGLLLTRAAGMGDIRSIGSGNIGATNVLRTGNKKLAAATLLLDGAKGAFAVGVAWYFTQGSLPDCTTINCSGHCPCRMTGGAYVISSGMLTAGLGAILGHVFPVWLKFKGGKGVATTLGMLLALAPWTGAAACATWLIVAFSMRFSSLSALIAMLSTPVSAYFIYKDIHLSLVCAIIAALVFYTHRSNIGRLLRGEEPKIGKKKE